MNKIYPRKLKTGDEIRVIAPAASLSTVTKQRIKLAEQRLIQLGFVVTYGKNVWKKGMFSSSSIRNRLFDLHSAFKDKKIAMVLAARGGYNSNQLLEEIDYKLLKKNPKILCGFSDITVLSNAIFAKIGLVTYSGPNFSGFTGTKAFEYTQEYFLKCFTTQDAYSIEKSKSWIDERWSKNAKNIKSTKNSGWYSINLGTAQGTIIGGNLCSLNLLQGTEYMLKLKNPILFLEEDDLAGKDTLVEFDRNLVSLLQNIGNIRGLVIGRFQQKSEVTKSKLVSMIKSNPKLKNIPGGSQCRFRTHRSKNFIPNRGGS